MSSRCDKATMAIDCHQDPAQPAVYEYLSSDLFWLLGAVICGIAYWTNQQVELCNELKHKTELASKTSANTSSSSQPTAPSPRRTCLWLQPHITSRSRQFLAIMVCSLVFPLQLLEGSWVLKTAWRMTKATLKRTYPGLRPYFLGFALYLPVTVIMLAAWAAVLGAGVFLVVSQLLYILQLRDLRPISSGHLKQLARKMEENSGGWDKLEDVAVVDGGEKIVPRKM